MKTSARFLIVFFLLVSFVAYSNHFLAVRREAIPCIDIPDDLQGLKIVHLSDLHGFTASWYLNSVLRTVRQENPDLIVFSGDLVDSGTPDISRAAAFMGVLKDEAPVFFVPGNHDYGSGQSTALFNTLEDEGIVVLRDEIHPLDLKNHTLYIAGLDDPLGMDWNKDRTDILNRLNSQNFHPLLMVVHRPELFSYYTEANPVLIAAGHAHGGQLRLPGIGPLFAPDQGFLPEYTQGPYTANESTMIVSRGLANSIFPVRFNNRPEIVVITLVKSVDS